ncbi:MAG TPA: HTH domain-containing protein [bacterium]|nr:HTH domain-containing protein [bacterium]
MLKDFSPYNLIKEAVSSLKPNEKIVILGRFGIDSNRKTLSSIGRELKLSRERIRQIEKEGLRRVAKSVFESQPELVVSIVKKFEELGGVTNHNMIGEKFLNPTKATDKNEFNSLHLIFVIMPELAKIEKTKDLEAGWILTSIPKDAAVKIINDWVLHLEKTKRPEKLEILVEAHPEHKSHHFTFLSELPHVSKKLIKTDDGLVGLATWPEVNPRNVRDKIYYALKKSGKPMHFDEIAHKISDEKFDSKRVVKATVHNELIADERFVLIGRGIYALKEWGYSQGTVADIIKSVLKDKRQGLTVSEIVEYVLKQRVVKKNTILINLQTKPFFKKIGNRYALAQ